MAKRKLTPFDLVAVPKQKGKKREKPKTWNQVKSQARSNTAPRSAAGPKPVSKKPSKQAATQRKLTTLDLVMRRRPSFGEGDSPVLAEWKRKKSPIEKAKPIAEAATRSVPALMPVSVARDVIKPTVTDPVKTAKGIGKLAKKAAKVAKEVPFNPEMASVNAGPGRKRVKVGSTKEADRRLKQSTNYGKAFAASQYGAAKGYYHKPKSAIKGDAKMAGATFKALVGGGFVTALSQPNKTAEVISEDYKRRYNNGNPKGAAKNAQRIVEKEGGALTYGMDAATVGGAAGKGAGFAAKTRSKMTGKTNWATKPRKRVRISQNVTKKQRDETEKMAPNLFRVMGQRAVDRHRTKKFEKRDDRAFRTGENRRLPLRPGPDEVVYAGSRKRAAAQKKDAARSKAHGLLNLKRETNDATTTVDPIISERPKKGLNKHERDALSFVYEGIVPNDPKAAVKFLQERKAEIRANREASVRGEPTRFQQEADEIAVIDRLLKKPEKAFTPRVTEAADELRQVAAKAAKDSDALPTGRKLATRYGPQAHVLGMERGVRRVQNFDEAATRKALQRRGIDPDKALRGREASVEAPESVAQFVRRVREKGQKEGLQTPGYLPHVSKAGDVDPANYAIGGSKALGYKKRNLDNFKEGRVDRRPEAIREGIVKTIKVKHNHELVKKQFERHANPDYSNTTLSAAVQKMDADGIDPGEVRIWFPGKFKGKIRSDEATTNANSFDEPMANLSDDVKSASVEVPAGKAGINKLKELAEDPEFKDQKAVVVDKAIYDEIMSATAPSGAAGRTVDIVNAKTARAILGTGNVGWMAVDALSGASANAVGGVIPLGPTWWKAQVWYRKLPAATKRELDNQLGIQPRVDYVNQPHIGGAVENMPAAARGLVKGWQSWRRTPIGKLRPIGKPIDWFMLGESKLAVEPFRKAQAYSIAKKAARKGDMTPKIAALNGAMDTLVDVLKLGDSKRINAILENPRVAEEVARGVDNLLGDWITRTNAERKLLGRAGFFYPYMRYSLKMLFFTMPLEHPLVTGVLAKLSQAGAAEVKELMGGEEIPWGLGKIYYEKDGQLMESSMLKRANFMSNQVVSAESSDNLWGVLPPVLGFAASQLTKSNVYMGQDWTTDGDPSWNNANTDVWHRAQILAGQIINTPFATRVAGNVLSSGQKQSTDSIPLLGREKPLRYKRKEKIASQKKRVATKKKSSTFEQIGQAMGLLPKPSRDKEIAAERKKARVKASGGAQKSGSGFFDTDTKAKKSGFFEEKKQEKSGFFDDKPKTSSKPKKKSVKSLVAKAAPELDKDQKEIVAQIISIGKEVGASDKEIKAAISTGRVESNFRNSPVMTDHDSQGWRQERASLYKDPTNLRASIKRFYAETKQADKKGLSAGDLAAAVQRPAAQYRGRYAQNMAEAEKILAVAKGGKTPAAPSVKRTGKTIIEKTGLKKTSDYRDPKHNAAVGGVPNSYHTRGSKKNPQAMDFVGSEAQMQKGAKIAREKGLSALIHDAGSGRHLHIQNDGAAMGSGGGGSSAPSGGGGYSGGSSGSYAPPSRQLASNTTQGSERFFDTAEGRMALLDFINSKSKDRTKKLIFAMKAAQA